MYAYTKEETLLTISDLNVSFGNNHILKNVNASIKNIVRPNMEQGQVVALLGPSGVGKTQFFRCLAGLQKPTSGNILLNGDKHVSAPGEVGVVAQNYIVFNHRTVRSNLEIVPNKTQKSETERKEQIDKLLEKFSLSEHQNKYPAQLSGGQRQRLAIIQQLLCSKYFLLMDEPFSGLDLISKQNVCDLITDVSTSDELSTIIITTHDINTAVSIADTIWVLGRNFDDKKVNQGASIVQTFDLMERNIAWHPDNKNLPQFTETVKEIESLFYSL